MDSKQQGREALGREISVWKDELSRLTSEIKLQLHLGGMEAKDAWKRIEPKLQRFERDAEQFSDEMVDEFKEMGEALRKELQKLRDRLQEDGRG